MSQTPVLLLRGLLREERHWGDFPYLLEHSLERSVITLTLAGVGKRCHELSPDTIPGMTEDLRAKLATHYPDVNKVIIVGLSMGGMIALDWSSRYPAEVEGAALINTSAKPLARFYQRLRWQNYPKILAGRFCSAAHQEKLVLQITSNRPPDPALVRHWRSLRSECPLPKQNVINQLKAVSGYRLGQRPSQPITVICSEQDRMVNPVCSEKLARHWQLPIVRHPTAGHDIPIDDPEWLCSEIKKLVQGD